MNQRLTRELLARTALDLLDRDGLQGLSMRRLAAELGVDPMAAYRHLPGKEALLDAVVDAVLGEVDLDALTATRAAAGPWVGLRALVGEVLDAMRRHPGTASLLAGRAWTTPAGWGLVDWGLETLLAAGVEEHRAVVTMNMTGLFLTALAQAEASAGRVVVHPDPDLHPTAARLVASPSGNFTYPELLTCWEQSVLGSLGAPPLAPWPA